MLFANARSNARKSQPSESIAVDDSQQGGSQEYDLVEEALEENSVDSPDIENNNLEGVMR